MTSADSSAALTTEASPGKVRELSARAVSLYPMRLLVTVGFCVCSHAHRPHRGLIDCSCSYGRAFALDFFQLTRLAAAALSFATVAVTDSDHFFQMMSSRPCRAHEHRPGDFLVAVARGPGITESRRRSRPGT